jgi:hypothetical protein
MALKASQPDAITRFSLEDVFAGGDADTLAWVSGWRKLPHLQRDVEKLFDYPQQFAEDIFDRIEQALRKRASDDEANAGVQTGRLFIFSDDDLQADSKVLVIPESYDENQLLSDRREGKCLLSYQTSGGWVAITKAVLTEVLGAGLDVKIVGLPPAAAGVLKLMCPNLVAPS